MRLGEAKACTQHITGSFVSFEAAVDGGVKCPRSDI